MSEIKVNFGSLEAGQAGIKNTHGQLVSTLDEFEANLQPMLQTGTVRPARPTTSASRSGTTRPRRWRPR